MDWIRCSLKVGLFRKTSLHALPSKCVATVAAMFIALPSSLIGMCVSVCVQVLWGLAYLKHEKRVHRDIKPPNILINSEGQVKLTDFGISKSLQNSRACCVVCRHGVVLATPCLMQIVCAVMCATFVGSFKYMAPERMLHSKYDYSADIWSLGIVLMELALGKYPYVAAVFLFCFLLFRARCTEGTLLMG